MNLQSLASIMIVALAAVGLARRFYSTFVRPSKPCLGCGQSACHANQLGPELVEIENADRIHAEL